LKLQKERSGQRLLAKKNQMWVKITRSRSKYSTRNRTQSGKDKHKK